MNNKLKPGISHRLETVVKDSDSARSYGSGLLDVYASPAMIALMEKTAMECVEACLPEGSGTVGVSVNVRHLKASAVGAKLSCTATLKEIDNKLLLFEVGVMENGVLVGTGTHERFIVDEKRFIDKLNLK